MPSSKFGLTRAAADIEPAFGKRDFRLSNETRYVMVFTGGWLVIA
jgi:hypothetical protein